MKKEITQNLMLDTPQLRLQYENISWFIKQIHPFTIEDKYHNECLEIRPVGRGDDSFYSSCNLWRMDNKGEDILKSYLSEFNGKRACLYYSVFTLDYKKVIHKNNGEKYIKGHINNQNALYTQVLVMDFDKITHDEYMVFKNILKSLDIDTISIFTGHGYQDIILLSEKISDMDILSQFTKLLIRKGFKVDSTIVDPARVMRLPNTFNCKSFCRKTEYYSSNPVGIFTEMIDKTTRRYSCKEVFDKVNSIPDDPSNLAIEELSPYRGDDFMMLSYDYKGIDISSLPVPVQRMLFKTKEGLRNSVMLFLIPFFKNTLKFSSEQIINVMKVWGRRCTPSLDPDFVISETKRLMTYTINAPYGSYISEFTNEFGNMSLYFLDIDKRGKKITISNTFFRDFDKIPDGAVKIYLSLKYFEKCGSKKFWSAEEIIKKIKISQATFYRYIHFLISKSFVERTLSYKKGKECYTYYINNRLNMQKGYTALDVSTVKTMLFHPIKKLTDGEIKLFSYICFMSNSNNKCWAGQEHLGIMIRKKRNSICQMTKSLQLKGYLYKDSLSNYCDKNNIEAKKTTVLKFDKFYEFVCNCYREDKCGYKKHCVYSLVPINQLNAS